MPDSEGGSVHALVLLLNRRAPSVSLPIPVKSISTIGFVLCQRNEFLAGSALYGLSTLL